MVSPRCRRPPASSPTPSPRRSFWRLATKRPRSSRHSRRQAEVDPRGVVLVIDNYDSFTYNLVQYLGELGEEVRVVRNDAMTVDEIAALKPSRIVISPGPCTPKEAGVSIETIKRLAGAVPILGVCLGHQSIGEAFGGDVVRAERLMHGKTSQIKHDGRTIFNDLPNPFEATRYH